MRLKLPRYVHGFIDRHGTARYYYRRYGKRTALPGLPWSPQFIAAYEEAKENRQAAIRPIGCETTLPGSIKALTVAYFNSAEFQTLAVSTRSTYRGILENFRLQYGDRSAVSLDRRAIAALVNQKAATPAAAGNRLRMIRLLMRFAIAQGWREDDPTVGVKPPRSRSGGFHTWTEGEIAAFEAKHPRGTRARLALDLLLWTAQRRGDVVLMGRQNIQHECLTIRQQKTGATVQIPVHSALRASIDAYPNKNMTFLVTENGKPFSSAGFGNWFREVCREAGLPDHCAAHGLRKAAARRLAEAGCTAHQIMAITGHKTLREVTRYTEAADRQGLAAAAMAKIEQGTSSGKLQ
jgi:integrase